MIQSLQEASLCTGDDCEAESAGMPRGPRALPGRNRSHRSRGVWGAVGLALRLDQSTESAEATGRIRVMSEVMKQKLLTGCLVVFIGAESLFAASQNSTRSKPT